jgi:hypothetical protein
METTKPTIEDLLKPRYRVIALWPYCDEAIGTIYSPRPVEQRLWVVMGEASGFIHPSDKNRCTSAHYERFPHLFKKLEWWEDRKPEEMPQYVKYAENGMVAKVDRFDMETTSAWFMYLEGGIHPYCPGGSALENTHWLPATESEYNEYITSHP